MIITVNASRSYDVIVDKNVLPSCGKIFRKLFDVCKIALIVDSNVDRIYSSPVVESLKKENYDVYKFVFKAGEKSKNLSVFGDIQNFLSRNSFSRSDVIVALGGGVAGDLAGFCAATYMRGIRYVQIPTTLLAAIDASVGGKTAIDTVYGKNLIGAFHQPSLVISDTDTFKSLPCDVVADGMGEFAKYALLIGGEFADKIDNNAFCVSDMVSDCVAFKKNIVECDEFERGERKLLNLGHTIAHAIEKIENYTISHGKAVAIGLNAISYSCMRNGICSEECYNEVAVILKNCGVFYDFDYDVSEIISVMKSDKKRINDGISLVLIKSVGNIFVKNMNMSEAEAFLCRS